MKTFAFRTQERITNTERAKDNKSTINQPFFVDLVTLEKMYFQNIPLTLDYDPQSAIVALPSYGRNLVNYQFTGAEDVLKFDMSFYGDTVGRDDVVRRCKWLEALSKDDGQGNGLHQVKLVFGDLYQDAKWIVKSAPVKYGLFHRQHGMLPQLATVTVTLCKVSDDNPDRYTILKVGS